MANDLGNEKQHAHKLIEQLPPHQLSAVVGLLEAMIDPVGRKLASAPTDDEPETEEERRAVEQSREWLRQRGGKGIPHEEVLRNFGLTTDDFHRLAHGKKIEWTDAARADVRRIDRETAFMTCGTPFRSCLSGIAVNRTADIRSPTRVHP
jgi:hypothetical protein